jgi:6-phosphogluconolactonase
MSVEIEVVEDPARACGELLVSAAAARGHIVLAGGSTPRAAYEDFVQRAESAVLPLADTTMWFGDERCVPPDDSRSNYLMAKQSLLDPLGDGGPGSVRRIAGELGPDAAASSYEEELRSAGPPVFDLLLLGIGPDGHTASMFPDQDSLSEGSRLVAGVPQAGLEPFVPRVTLTLPGLALAGHIVFLVSGESKAEAVWRAFGPSARPDPHVPSSMVPTVAGRVTVLLDAAAAGRL